MNYNSSFVVLVTFQTNVFLYQNLFVFIYSSMCIQLDVQCMVFKTLFCVQMIRDSPNTDCCGFHSRHLFIFQLHVLAIPMGVHNNSPLAAEFGDFLQTPRSSFCDILIQSGPCTTDPYMQIGFIIWPNILLYVWDTVLQISWIYAQPYFSSAQYKMGLGK